MILFYMEGKFIDLSDLVLYRFDFYYNLFVLSLWYNGRKPLKYPNPQVALQQK